MRKVCGECKPGWHCHRDEGHDGPHAAWPTEPEQIPWIGEEAGSDLTIESLKMAETMIKTHLATYPQAENRLLEIALGFVERGRLGHLPPPTFPPSGGSVPAYLIQ